MPRNFRGLPQGVHERHRSPFPSPSRSPRRSSKPPKERKLHTTEWAKWPRDGTVLGWSDPTFAHGSVAKVSRGSLQPNKKILLVRGARIWAKQLQKVKTTHSTFVFTCFFTPWSAQFL